MRITRRPLSPAGAHYSFGYYDRCPYSPDGRWHLALRLPHNRALPAADEQAVLCRIECASGVCDELSPTWAWNHQQGSMQHWLPQEPDHVIFNDRDGEHLYSRVVDAQGRTVRRLPRPIYCLSKDGQQAISLDFGRIPRRGYSYAVADPSRGGGPRRVEDDGLWLMDTTDGRCQRLCSYAEMLALHPEPEELATDPYIWLNHAILNVDDSRCMVLLRYELAGRRQTYLYTVGLDGRDLRCALPAALWRAGKVTHQIWGRRPDEILIDAEFNAPGNCDLTVFTDGQTPPVFRRLDGLGVHGHQSFSPDGRYAVSDTYPRDEDLQRLYLWDIQTGTACELGRFAHPRLGPSLPFPHDCRCDLHPRWRPDCRGLSIDSLDEGYRRIYELRWA